MLQYRLSRSIRTANATAQLAWLRQVDLLTEGLPTVPIGEIVEVDRRRNEICTGVYAARKVCLSMPAYYLFGLFIPFVQRIVDRRNSGCRSKASELPHYGRR